MDQAVVQQLRLPDPPAMTAVAPAREHSARYVAVAGLSALLSNGILIGGNRVGLGTTEVVLLSWFVTGTLAYALHTKITFRARWEGGSWVRFLAGAAAGIPAAWLLLQLFVAALSWPMLVAAPLATAIMFAYHYANARLAITRTLFRFSRAT